MKIIWTDKVIDDLAEILTRIEKKFGLLVAKEVGTRIVESIDLLAIFPEMGKIQDDKKKFRAIIINKRTTVFYRIEKESIVLVAIIDNRQLRQ